VLESKGVITKLFADDVKVYLQTESNDDCNIFQKTWNLISCWANEWQLQLPVGA